MIVALAGGVGGAKLARGLAALLPPEQLLIVVNTGDDFQHLGLHVSPDLDTVMYTLAGRSNRTLGWGLADESWHFMEALALLGGETWFRLGDRDLATHVQRTSWLREGASLSAVTARLHERYGVRVPVVPMSDDPVRTIVQTHDGALAFQDYFVRRRCEPVVVAVRYEAAAQARPAAAFAQALERRDLEAVVICPSNPLLSIGPILALPGIRERLAALAVPRIAVTPIIAGDAVKGPAAKILRELGHEPSPAVVARWYGTAINGMLVDQRDATRASAMRGPMLAVEVADTMMTSDADQQRVARAVLDFAVTMRRP